MDNSSSYSELFSTDDIFIISNQPTKPNKDVDFETTETTTYKTFIFSDYSIAKEEKEFLSKVLRAVNIDLNECKFNEKTDLNSLPITNNNIPTFVFSQNTSDVSEKANKIYAPAISSIANDINYKKALWELMQKIFSQN